MALNYERKSRHAAQRPASVLLMLALLLLASCGSRMTQEEIAIRASGTANAARVDRPGSASSGPRADGAVPGSATDVGAATGSASGAAVGGAAGAAGAGAPAAPNKGAPIVIGTVGNFTGVVGAAYRPAVVAMQAWVKSVNARGGINGHPIVQIVRDDGSDPARNAAAVQDLVENEHVIAFVGDFAALSNQGGADYLAKRHIPVVGGDTYTPLWYQNPMFFPQTADFRAQQVAALKGLAALMPGRNLGTLVCQEAQACSESEAAFNKAAAATGWNVTYNGKGSLVQPDYTANCLAARGAKVDAFAVILDGPSTKRLARSCKDQGFQPRYVLGQAVDTNYATPDFEGSVLANLVFPFVGSGLPAAKEFEETLSRYAPDEPKGGFGSIGWTAAKLFEAAAQHVGAQPTTADILDGLYALHGDTLGGLTVPLTFNRNAPATPVPCSFVMVVSGGHFTAPNGATPTCQR